MSNTPVRGERGAEDAPALERLRASGEAIVRAVEDRLEPWTVAHVTRILDVWGKADTATRVRAEAHAQEAGRVAAIETAAELRALFEVDVAEQRVTPLEIVRRATRRPTSVLERAGVPPVVRDGFDERAFPDDPYDLAPRTLADLGDESLGPLQLAWGMAKAAVLRARAAPA